MDSLTQTSLHTEALVARFRAERTTRWTGADGARAQSQSTSVDRFEFSAESTAATLNGVLNDSIVERINEAIQKAGIDLRIDTNGSFDVSPEGTAHRIADFATGYLEAYSESRAAEPAEIRIEGFMSLIREAIKEGFSQAKDFLSGITKLSEALSENIDRTFALTTAYLDDFGSAQLAAAQQQATEAPDDDTPTGVEL